MGKANKIMFAAFHFQHRAFWCFSRGADGKRQIGFIPESERRAPHFGAEILHFRTIMSRLRVNQWRIIIKFHASDWGRAEMLTFALQMPTNVAQLFHYFYLGNFANGKAVAKINIGRARVMFG